MADGSPLTLMLDAVEFVEVHYVYGAYLSLMSPSVNLLILVAGVVAVLKLWDIAKDPETFRYSQITDFIARFLAIFAVITGWAYFYFVFYDPLVKLPADVGSVFLDTLNQLASSSASGQKPASLSGATAVEVFESFGASVNDAVIALKAKIKSADDSIFWGVYYGFMGIVIELLYFVMIASAFSVVVMAKLGTAILLAMGPLFIILWIAPATREFAQRWLMGLIYFFMMQVLAYGYMIFGGAVGQLLIGTVIADINGTPSPSFYEIGPLMTVMFLVIVAMKWVPVQATLFAGGTAAGHQFNPAGQVNRASITTLTTSMNVLTSTLRAGAAGAKGAWGALPQNDPSSERSKAAREAEIQMKVRDNLRGFDRNN